MILIVLFGKFCAAAIEVIKKMLAAIEILAAMEKRLLRVVGLIEFIFVSFYK
jgi:hypothetical protein